MIIRPEASSPNDSSGSDAFTVDPQSALVESTGQKRFAVSFTPSLIGICRAVLEMQLDLPEHLNDDKFSVRLVGESCVPEVHVVEPSPDKRERVVVNFGRVLVAESSGKGFAFQNTGLVQAKAIVEILEDPDFLFSLSAESDGQRLLNVSDREDDACTDRYTAVRLAPKGTARFEVRFHPRDIGKYHGQIRLFIVDNPYENPVIRLEGEGYHETVVLDGLSLVDEKLDGESAVRRSNAKIRRSSARQSSGLTAVSSTSLPSPCLVYKLDYGDCFVSKMYKRSFKIVNKSRDRCFRFQWAAHPHLVFVPSIGHLKYGASKEITATFLCSEPTVHTDTSVDCVLYEIETTSPVEEASWDDRQTRDRWEEIDTGSSAQLTDESAARKVIEANVEPDHEGVPGTTKVIRTTLTATVAYSEYVCDIKEINFDDTLVFQKRNHAFTLSNPGIVRTEYRWKISMDEQYPIRLRCLTPRCGSARKRSAYDRSRPCSRSFGDAHCAIEEFEHSDSSRERSANDDENLLLHRCGPLFSRASETTMEMKPRPLCSSRQSDLFSSTAGLTERSADSWTDGSESPFEIVPEIGTLSPGESVECVLKFAPMDVLDYKAYLTCTVENLDSKQGELVATITGRGLLPYCHFDLAESDYVSGGRRDPRLPGPMGYQLENNALPESTRVIEFRITGVGKTHTKEFFMINPTSESYRFTWEDRTFRAPGEMSNFHCVVPEGTIDRGKRMGLAFTFFAENFGTFESFWLFSIERYDVRCLFLLAAVVNEPAVYCSKLHVKMRPTVIGAKVCDTVTIINKEDFDVPFRISKDSLYSDGRLQTLAVKPARGTLTPLSEQSLRIEYDASLVGEFRFSVHCCLNMTKKPLAISVTATAYSLVPSISYTDLDGRVTRVHDNKKNIVDLGSLTLKKPITIKFDILNVGKVAFYYAWDLGMTPEVLDRNAFGITMPQRQGHVASDSRSTCCLTFVALQKVTIKGHPVTIRVNKGPTYRLALKATASRPAVEFSFTRHDFGPRYISQTSEPACRVELKVKNSTDSSVTIECLHEERPHLSVKLDGILEALAPRSTATIPIDFSPMEQIKYCDKLTFTIDSTFTRTVTIRGEGITYNVRLVNARDKSIDLGSLSMGESVTKKVPIVNDARAPIALRFDVLENLPGYERHRRIGRSLCARTSSTESHDKRQERASISETKRSDTHDATLHVADTCLGETLKVEPSDSILLRPNKRTDVSVTFAPKRKMSPFAVKVAFQTESDVQPLFVVRGCCVAAEFRLNRAQLFFGVTVRGCVNEAKLLLSNTGDVGARFKWNTAKLPSEFSVVPAAGYCSPGTSIDFVVFYRPTSHPGPHEGDAVIEIEKYRDLAVKIKGMSCELPEPTDVLSFETIVRTRQTRTVNIDNDTESPWRLKPEVSGEYFQTDDILTVQPKTSGSCVVAYTPLVMNTNATLHTGSLLVKLPNGARPVLYSLRGRSTPPRVIEKIARQLPAKTRYTESLPVYNWLSRQQKFERAIELSNEPKETPLFSFTGGTTIDVPANSQRDYRADFYCYKECELYFTVTFTNEEGEYQFYEIHYSLSRPEVIESIKLTTNVRARACRELRLENPLEDRSVTYTVQSHHPDVVVRDMPKTVQPLSTESVTVEYRPLLASEESTVPLDIDCEELGRFPYELRLRALPALPEEAIRVTASLGSSCTFTVVVRNKSKSTAKFTVNVNNDCFACPKSLEVAALCEASLPVTYEPCDINNVEAALVATSAVAGQFTFPLIGTYSLPKPRGPYTILQRAITEIPFKNVLQAVHSFEADVDAPDVFEVDAALTNMRPKQEANLCVKLRSVANTNDALDENSFPVTGKLVIYPIDSRVAHVRWTYYLRAVFE